MSGPHETIGHALTILTEGLGPFVEVELRKQNGENWQEKVRESYRSNRREIEIPGDGREWDAHALLMVMWDRWNICFRTALGHQERSLVSELREFRNQWAHQKAFSFDDTYRILDSMERLLNAIHSDKAEEISALKEALLNQKLSDEHDLITAAPDLKTLDVVEPSPPVEQRRNKYVVAALYVLCAAAIITQLFISWKSSAYLMIGFVAFVFAFLIYEQVRTPKNTSQEEISS